jgi:methylmalonyl-CoA mutase
MNCRIDFDRIRERGGVLGAMETGYQRGRIQDESTLYEQHKHDGSLPVIAVNTFRNPDAALVASAQLVRATEEEKKSQLRRVRDFTERHWEEAHAALAALKDAARSGGNVYAILMDTAGYAACSRSPRRSSRSTASTAATSERTS